MLGLDEVRVAIVGAALCPAEIVEFWQGLGVRLAELYGMSETTRVKELIINATGKNMSPANIEATVRAQGGLIGQVCCIGDGQPYNVALITLEPDIAAAFAARHAIADRSLAALATDKRIRAEVAAAVNRANARLARMEQIKRFALLAVDWPPGGDELTPTMNLKRKPITDKYATEIKELYR
jgi:long-subunit acyl-CoA synthetase (AMP-forming)